MRLPLLLGLLVLAGCASVSRMSPEQAEPVVTVENYDLMQREAFNRLARWAAVEYAGENEAVTTSAPGLLVVREVDHDGRRTMYPLGYTTAMEVREGRVRFTQEIGEPAVDRLLVAFVADTAAGMAAHVPEVHAEAMAALSGRADF